MESALKSIDQAIAIDPEFALSRALKARLLYFLERNGGLQSALKSIELEPTLAEGYAALGLIKWAAGNWIESESAFRQALELTNEPSTIWSNDLGMFYVTVGYFDNALDLLKESLGRDPLNVWIRTSYISCLGIKGYFQQAEEEDAHCRVLLGDQWDNDTNWAITWVRLGHDDAVTRDRVLYSDLITNTAKRYLDSPKEGLLELHRLFNENDNLTNSNLADISIWAAYFDDPEFAMDATERAYSLTAMRLWVVWYPLMKEVRQLPRFKEFVREIGLVDYWNEFGWPDICRQLDNGNFVCD
jgi:tetratricopeptide (TPR) repeat protein